MRNINLFLIGALFICALSACATSPEGEHLDQKTQNLQKISNELRKGISISFDSNSSLLRPQDFEVLHAAATLLKSNPKLYLIIEGHTDNSGNETVNQRVSFARANAVKSELSKTYYVNPDQLITKAKGANFPIDSNDTESGRAHNRRTTLILNIR
ncbi:OmpA family protein [Acinetobacter gerneri]|uniref:OmpA family protein n=1 Tax=Acinetobacter gerneri TaxID=202952 RepID=UPI0028AA49C5|nr:OmpA family protein [Acinetobacter gerneri]